MRKHLWAALLIALLLAVWAAALPASAGDYPVAVVNSTSSSQSLPLYTAPKKSAESLGQYYNGVIVVVKEKGSTGWWKVDVFGRTGYMDSSFLSPCGLQSGYDQTVIDSIPSAMPKAAISGQRPQDGLHLRNRPSTSGSSYGKFYNGTPVEILGVINNGAWYHVYLPETKQWGFMLAKYVRTDASTGDNGGTPEPVKTGVYAVINNPNASDRLNLRASASNASNSLGKFYNGTTVEVLNTGVTWCKVKVNGKTGYMLTKNLLMDSSVKSFVTLDVGRTINEEGNTSYQPLCSAPFSNASKIKVPHHEGNNALIILGKTGTWYYVEINGVKGYYPVNRVTPGIRNPGKKNIAVVTSPDLKDRLNLRASASNKSRSLGKYFAGTQAEVLEYNTTDAATRETTWYKVRVNGQVGYMQAKYLQDIQLGEPASW